MKRGGNIAHRLFKRKKKDTKTEQKMKKKSRKLGLELNQAKLDKHI